MKVLLLSPTVRPALTGNATTVERWSTGLRARGHACRVMEAGAAVGRHELLRAVEEARPDVLHLHHAHRSGRFVDDARAHAAVVVSFAGTDLVPGTARDVVLRAG